MRLKNKLNQNKFKFVFIIFLVSLFVSFSNKIHKNRTFAKMNDAYKLSDTYKQESLVELASFCDGKRLEE